MFRFNVLSKNHFWRNSALVVVLILITTSFIISKISQSETKINIDGESFSLGQVYPAEFSTYYPSGPNAIDALGKTIDPKQAHCKAVFGFPYGTKFRIFGTGSHYDGNICVASDQIEANAKASTKLQFRLLSTNQDEIYWKRSGRVIILSRGDGKTLNFTDTQNYQQDDPSVKSKKISYLELFKDNDIKEQFYIKNNINYYRPKCKDTDYLGLITADISRDERFEYTLRFFTDLGFSLNQAAGMVANLSAESKLMPSCLEGGGDPCCRLNFYNESSEKHNCEYDINDVRSGQGFGLIQFTDSGEKATVKKLSEVRQKHHFDFSLQLEAIMIRTGSARHACLTGPKQISNKVKNQPLHKAQTATDASFTFLDCYAIPRSGNCGWGKKLQNGDTCYSDVVEKLGQVCLPHSNKTPGRPGLNGRAVSRCVISDAIANAVYQQAKNNRAFLAETLAKKYRGLIPDGKGIDVAKFRQIADDFMNDKDHRGFYEYLEDRCSKKIVKLNNRLQSLVAKAAWPLDCSQNISRREAELSCDAKRSTDFYKKLSACRQGERNGYCNFRNTPSGQDSFGFIASMLQESSWDETYTISADRKTNWTKIFKIGEVDTSQLQAGDVGIRRSPVFHTVLFVGDIPGFEHPIVTAGPNQAPGASPLINQAHHYNWYRKVSETD